MKKWGQKVVGKEYRSTPSNWSNVFCRRKYIHVLNPKAWNVQHPLCGHFDKCLCQIWDRLTLHCGSETFKKNYHQAKSAFLSQVCLQENWLCLLVLTILLLWKPEMSSACTPGGKLVRGNLCKLKFVTVGRTVALQPRPISGCTASQLHCKVLKILPPTPEYIYMYIKKKSPVHLSVHKRTSSHCKNSSTHFGQLKQTNKKKAYIIFFLNLCTYL